MRCHRWYLILLVVTAFFRPLQAHCADVEFHEGVGGSLGTVVIKDDDSLVELARTYDIGYNEITAANPSVDPFVPEPGTKVTIPTKWILPDAPMHPGIVVNLADMRLYLFPRQGSPIATFPIGIGDEGWGTPLGSYTIVERIVHPAWYVPASIRAQKPELPAVVPPGPNNPLGSHALRLSIGTVLIHGTDRPFGIGMRVSHGCIHLYPEDIVALYKRVSVGTRVTVVNQPVKLTQAGERVLIEVHGQVGKNLMREAWSLLEKQKAQGRVDQKKLKAALEARSGIVTDVTR